MMNIRTENVPADTVAIMEYVDDGFGGKNPSVTFSTIEETQKQHHIIADKIEGDCFSILPGSVIFVPYGYHYDNNGCYPRYLKVTTEKEYILKPKDE